MSDIHSVEFGETLDDAALIAELVTDEPLLRMNFVSSVDGAATHRGQSGGLSGEADKRLFQLLRRVCDVVLVGAGTVRIEGYEAMRVSAESVRWRHAAGLPEHPVFAIVSGSLDLDPASRIFTDAPVRPIVITTERAPAGERARFDALADVIVCGQELVDVDAMLGELRRRGLAHILCEGGPTLFGTLLAADAVDELCITISAILESGSARRIANGTLPDARGLTLKRALASGSTLLLRYGREKTEDR
ncbi:pyrimidine reductase family protein [Cryobacterium sp. BB307]|uniref:pyrimidine reductase family protein n=1 Tax=Cryobacterium sp. BB307 TaxID=2716317 RepID=UPI0032C1CFC7